MQNDSDTITLPQGFGSGGGGGSGDNGGDQGGGGNFTVGTTTNSGGGSSGGGLPPGSGSDGGGDSLVIVSVGGGGAGNNSTTTQSVVNALTNSGAVTVTQNNSSTGSANAANNSGSNGSIVSISGAKVRAALKDKGISAINFSNWDDSATFSADSNFTPTDVGLIASAAILQNQTIQQVTLSEGRLDITYLQKGYLLWLIPLSFDVRITVDLSPGAPQAVTVTFPWYRFFTWTDISPTELGADINAAIIGNTAAGLNAEDAQARLFTEVSGVLKSNQDADVSSITKVP